MSSIARTVTTQVGGSRRTLVRWAWAIHRGRVCTLDDQGQKRGTSACEPLPSLAHLIPD